MLRETVEDLCAFTGRGACTDSERRAALWLHDDLRTRGHEAWVETVWVRPQWALSLFAHSALGVVASLLSTGVEIPALVLAVLVFVSYALELAGRGGLLALALYRRATQLVVVEPRDRDAIALLISAHTDAPRRGLLLRDGWRRIGARLRPGPLVWVVVALGLVVVACAVRVAGAEGPPVGAPQFAPTIMLLIAAAAALDIALSEFSPGASDDASGVAVALALHEELVTRAPGRLSAGLLLAGAGDLQPLALRRHLRMERPRAEATVVLMVGPCGDGAPVVATRHHQLRDAAAETPVTRRGAPSLGGRIPAAAVRCVDERDIAPRARTVQDTPDRVSDAAMTAALDACLALVDALDGDLRTSTPQTVPNARL